MQEADAARGVGRAQATIQACSGLATPLARFPVCNMLPIPGHRREPTPQVLPEEEAGSVSVIGLGRGGAGKTTQPRCPVTRHPSSWAPHFCCKR